MKKTAKIVLISALSLPLIAGCSQSTQRPVAAAPTKAEPQYEPGLHPIYVAPGPVLIDGGTRPSSSYISPDDPFVTDYVLRRPVGSEYDPAVNVAVGGRVPDGFRILDVPSTGYAYTMINGKTVLVDPQRRRIVKVYPAG